MNIHIFDLSYESSKTNAYIFCQIASSYPIKKIIGKTKSLPVSQKINWDESFNSNDVFIKKLKFNIYLQSFIKGTSLFCSFNYRVYLSDSNQSNDQITLENAEKKLKLTFSIKRIDNLFNQQNEINESEVKNDTEIDKNRYEINDFLSFAVISNKAHQIALIHVSNDQKTLQTSCPHFSYLKSIIFQSHCNTTSVLIDVHKTFPTFQFFFIAIQLQKTENEKNENESVEIEFFANSDLKRIFNKKIEGIANENIYVPIFFSFSSNTNSAFCEILSIDQVYENKQIQNLYQQEIISEILKSKNLKVENIYKGLLFTGNLRFREDMNILKIFLKYSTKDKIDMSLNTVSESGTLEDICFFNRPIIMNKSIMISTQPYHFYVEYAMIDLSKLKNKIGSILITLTSFFGKPLSEINCIEIVLTDDKENLITSIPITIDDDLPGFVVGSIQKCEQFWELKYVGYSCDFKVPNLAAKAFLSTLCTVDDDVVEWKDDV